MLSASSRDFSLCGRLSILAAVVSAGFMLYDAKNCISESGHAKEQLGTARGDFDPYMRAIHSPVSFFDLDSTLALRSSLEEIIRGDNQVQDSKLEFNDREIKDSLDQIVPKFKMAWEKLNQDPEFSQYYISQKVFVCIQRLQEDPDLNSTSKEILQRSLSKDLSPLVGALDKKSYKQDPTQLALKDLFKQYNDKQEDEGLRFSSDEISELALVMDDILDKFKLERSIEEIGRDLNTVDLVNFMQGLISDDDLSLNFEKNKLESFITYISKTEPKLRKTIEEAKSLLKDSSENNVPILILLLFMSVTAGSYFCLYSRDKQKEELKELEDLAEKVFEVIGDAKFIPDLVKIFTAVAYSESKKPKDLTDLEIFRKLRFGTFRGKVDNKAPNQNSLVDIFQELEDLKNDSEGLKKVIQKFIDLANDKKVSPFFLLYLVLYLDDKFNGQDICNSEEQQALFLRIFDPSNRKTLRDFSRLPKSFRS